MNVFSLSKDAIELRFPHIQLFVGTRAPRRFIILVLPHGDLDGARALPSANYGKI
jgi:hypothetical protein